MTKFAVIFNNESLSIVKAKTKLDAMNKLIDYYNNHSGIDRIKDSVDKLEVFLVMREI